MEVWALQLFNGLSLSSILLLIALGLALSFGLMNVINLAHGEFIMIGAYTVYALQQVFRHFAGSPSPEITFLIAIPLSFLVAGGIGLLVEQTLIRFLYRRPLDTLLATWGVGLFLQQLARSIFGAPNVQVVAPSWLGGAIAITIDLVLPFRVEVRIFCLETTIRDGSQIHLRPRDDGATLVLRVWGSYHRPHPGRLSILRRYILRIHCQSGLIRR